MSFAAIIIFCFLLSKALKSELKMFMQHFVLHFPKVSRIIWNGSNSKLTCFSGCALFWFGYSRSGLPLYGDSMVWYNLFIMFSMYCMLPVPVKWCTICCLLTAIIHLILVVTLTSMSNIAEANQPSVSGYKSIFLFDLYYYKWMYYIVLRQNGC